MSEGILTPPVDPARDHLRGPIDAPLILLEYGDYECPHCVMVHGLVEGLRRDFGDALTLVWRQFPRPEHANAHAAAEAAEAAGAQGRYWEMHHLLLAHQDALQRADFERYAIELGLDIDRFRADLDAHTFHGRVGEDLASGVHSGAHATPTFFVNGVRHLGRNDDRDLRAVLQSALTARANAGSMAVEPR